ncbi:MAG: hypothetical protein WCO56_28405 [Verrucomicrobiota bacterium]
MNKFATTAQDGVTFNHLNGQLRIAGPNFFSTVKYQQGREILESSNFVLPKGDVIASVLHACFMQKDFIHTQAAMLFLHQLEKTGFWIYSRVYWTDIGVYTIDEERCAVNEDADEKYKDPKDIPRYLAKEMANGISLSNGVTWSRDGKIRFAPNETYRLGFHNAETLTDDGFAIALLGIEGAKKVAAIVNKFYKRGAYLAEKDFPQAPSSNGVVKKTAAIFCKPDLLVLVGTCEPQLKSSTFGIQKP